MEQLESVRTELSKHFSTEDVGLIQAIIDNVSYSKEAKQRKRGEPPSWVELGAGKSLSDRCVLLLKSVVCGTYNMNILPRCIHSLQANVNSWYNPCSGQNRPQYLQ